MKTYIITMLLFLSGILFAQTLTNDPAHSQLRFGATHLMISTVDGEFKDFKVELNFSKEDLSDAKFSLIAQTNSINTGVEARDTHLKSADFFDVKKFPELKFVTTSMNKVIGNQYDLEGDLTLHGITKKVKMKAYFNGKIYDEKAKGTRYGFTIKGNINKNDFGIGTSFPETMVGNQISISANMEFLKK